MDLKSITPKLRPDGRWWARKRVKGRKTPIAGYGRTPDEALADLREKLESLTSTESRAKEDLITLHDVARELWEPHILRLAPLTAKRYESSYVNHIKPKLGNCPLAELSVLRVRHWLDTLEAKPFSKSYALDVLTNILSHALKADLMPKNPCSSVSYPRPASDRERILDLEVALDLLEKSRESPVSAPVYLACVLGLRRSEIAGLKWTDLNRVTGELRIRRQRQASKGGVIERELKTKSSKRTLYLPKELIAEIDTRGDLDSEYITTYLGHPWIPDRITEKWNDFRGVKLKDEKVTLEDWHFHDLRRLAAGLLVAAGCNLNVVAAVLGHAKPDMSAVYVSVSDSLRKEGAEALALLLGRHSE